MNIVFSPEKLPNQTHVPHRASTRNIHLPRQPGCRLTHQGWVGAL